MDDLRNQGTCQIVAFQPRDDALWSAHLILSRLAFIEACQSRPSSALIPPVRKPVNERR